MKFTVVGCSGDSHCHDDDDACGKASAVPCASNSAFWASESHGCHLRQLVSLGFAVSLGNHLITLDVHLVENYIQIIPYLLIVAWNANTYENSELRLYVDIDEMGRWVAHHHQRVLWFSLVIIREHIQDITLAGKISCPRLLRFLTRQDIDGRQSTTIHVAALLWAWYKSWGCPQALTSV